MKPSLKDNTGLLSRIRGRSKRSGTKADTPILTPEYLHKAVKAYNRQNPSYQFDLVWEGHYRVNDMVATDNQSQEEPIESARPNRKGINI